MIPTRYNPPLVHEALAELRASTTKPLAGQFKVAFPVTVNGRKYMLKRGATDCEVRDCYWEEGDDNDPAWWASRRRECNGNADLLREVWAQWTGKVEAAHIVGYVAWCYVGRQFWALQPYVEHVPNTCEAPPINDASHNSGWLDGKLRCFDWGFAFRHVNVRPVFGCIYGGHER